MQLLLSFARQWVAGVGMQDALDRSLDSNVKGIGAIINLLGEHYNTREKVAETLSEYESILAVIQSQGLDACISVKLSQLGLNISEEYCMKVVSQLREWCRRAGFFLWLDMEGSEHTSSTLRVYEENLKVYPDIGVALQANLRRTEGDLRGLLSKGGVVRLCKGAYREHPSISYRRKDEIDGSFRRLMHILFKDGKRFALATHDAELIGEGLTLMEDSSCQVEFQMLLGVRDPLKEELASSGKRVLEYIPYGPRWLPYFSRRLRERPRNVVTMFRSLLET